MLVARNNDETISFAMGCWDFEVNFVRHESEFNESVQIRQFTEDCTTMSTASFIAKSSEERTEKECGRGNRIGSEPSMSTAQPTDEADFDPSVKMSKLSAYVEVSSENAPNNMSRGTFFPMLSKETSMLTENEVHGGRIEVESS